MKHHRELGLVCEKCKLKFDITLLALQQHDCRDAKATQIVITYCTNTVSGCCRHMVASPLPVYKAREGEW